MPIQKPFIRIFRPTDDGWTGKNFNLVLDERFANNRVELIYAFHMLEKDVKDIFDYVEPSDQNIKTYSHKIYSLFLRVCTEFEANCMQILYHNDYKCAKSNPEKGKPSQNSWNIKDYKKVNIAMKLSEYTVRFKPWKGEVLSNFKPCVGWSENGYLKWYKSYNEVKHNRATKFELANLENLVSSMGAVFSILFAQFGFISFFQHRPLSWIPIPNEDGYYTTNDSIFAIKPPVWRYEDQYDFEWHSLSSDSSPFEIFKFD